MTLRPEQLGYHGQRFEVRFTHPDDIESINAIKKLGWATDLERAKKLAASWRLRPGGYCVWVVDLTTGEVVS